MKDFIITVVSRVIGLFIGLATQSSLAWLLGPSGRGSYAVCLLFATFLNVFCAFGCDITTVYFVSSKKNTVSEGVLYAFIYGGLGSLLAIATGLVIMQFDFGFLSKASSNSFSLALLFIPVSLFSYTFLQMLTAIDRFKYNAIFTITQSVLILSFTLLFVWMLDWGVNGALLGLITGGLSTIIIVLIYLRINFKIKIIKPTLGHLKDMFCYGIRYYIGKVSNQLNFEVGTMVLAFFATREQIGVFSVASQLISRSMVIPNSMITVLIPRVSGDKYGKKELVAWCFRITLIFSIVFMLLVAIFAKPIIIILFSEKFAGAVPLLQIMCIGVIFRSACKVFVPYLLGTNHPGISSLSVFIGAIINLFFVWTMLPILGLSGAALAMVLGFFFSSIILMAAYVKLSKTGLMELLRYRYNDFKVFENLFHKITSKIRR